MIGHVDVVVVGAGPVGLLTAIELGLSGCRVLVLERLAAPNLGIKALSVGPLGSEALQRRGMADSLAAEEERNLSAMEAAGGDMRGRAAKFSGHFAGLVLRKDLQAEPERRMRAVHQQGLEAMLAERAQALGIEVRRGCEVTGLAVDAHGVEVEWASPAGADHVRCDWLVGCDGGRSTIRKLAGFAFPGTEPTSTLYQAIVELDHPERLAAGWRHRTSGGTYAYGGPFPNRLFMLDFSGPPANREAPVTGDEIEAALRRISGADVRVTALETANRWTDNTRLVDTYRRGRVLLAGDAAHIHSPFGGQGLSLGLVDAANLGWKLAAVVRGEMSDDLIDTYTAERRPVAEAVLANTLAQAAMMRPDPQSGAMRDILESLLRLDEVNRRIGEMMSGLVVRYDLGSKVEAVGRLVGDRPIGRGEARVSLYEAMQNGNGVLLDASDSGESSRLVAAIARNVRCIDVETGPSMLIRPDACIAWAGETDDMEGFEDSLRRWFPTRAEDLWRGPTIGWTQALPTAAASQNT